MEPSKDQKIQASQDAIKSVLGMASDNKSKLKSVKIKIKFDNKSKAMAAVRKKAVSFGASNASGDKASTR